MLELTRLTEELRKLRNEVDEKVALRFALEVFFFFFFSFFRNRHSETLSLSFYSSLIF